MLKRVFGRSTTVQPDQAALLEELRGQVDQSTLQAYASTSELPSGDTSGPEVDTLLLRYLAAEKQDVEKAAARLVKQAHWRQGFGTPTAEDIASELVIGKVKLQLPTASSNGRPLLVVKGRLHRPGSTPMVTNFIYYCLEAASHYCWHPANPDGKLVSLFDLSGLQMKNLDATALRLSFAMLEQHFPERVEEVYMYEAPTIFWGIWKIVYPFIDPATRKRIHFVYGKNGQERLVESLGTEIVPLEYGGTAAETAVEHAVQHLPAWRKQQLQQEGAQNGTAGQTQQAGKKEEEEKLAQQVAVQLHVSRSSPNLIAAHTEAS